MDLAMNNQQCHKAKQNQFTKTNIQIDRFDIDECETLNKIICSFLKRSIILSSDIYMYIYIYIPKKDRDHQPWFHLPDVQDNFN